MRVKPTGSGGGGLDDQPVPTAPATAEQQVVALASHAYTAHRLDDPQEGAQDCGADLIEESLGVRPALLESLDAGLRRGLLDRVKVPAVQTANT